MKIAVPLVALWLVAAGCVPSPFPYTPPARQGHFWAHERPAASRPGPMGNAPAAPPDLVVLVTLDGVRWQEVFDGVDRDLAGVADPLSQRGDARHLLPNLYRLIDRGTALGHPDARNAVCTANSDHRSLPGYQELFAGRPTRCDGNACGPIEVPTLLDRLRADGWGPLQAVAVGSWPMLRDAFGAAGSWFAVSVGTEVCHGLGRDRCADASRTTRIPVGAARGYRSDADTMRVALDAVHLDGVRFLFIGLCDADEAAHHSDYAQYLRSLRAEDAWIGRLTEEIERIGLERVTILVTTDHGRGWNFHDHGVWAWQPMHEADRVWLVAAGTGIRRAGIVAPSRTWYLADVAPTIERLLRGDRADAVEGSATVGSGIPITDLLEDTAGTQSRRSGSWRSCSVLPR